MTGLNSKDLTVEASVAQSVFLGRLAQIDDLRFTGPASKAAKLRCGPAGPCTSHRPLRGLLQQLMN